MVRWIAAFVLIMTSSIGLTLAARANDEPADAAAIARGDKIYHTLCWTCHGKYGRGHGPLAADLKKPAADLSRSALLLGDTKKLLATIRPDAGPGSHTPMVLGQVLTTRTMLDVIAYIRNAFPGGNGASVAAGRDLYNAVCWACHGLKGDGKGPYSENIESAGPRDFTSPEFVIDGREEEIFRVISSGAAEAIHGSKEMRGWGVSFAPQRIHDLIAYLKTLKQRGRIMQ